MFGNDEALNCECCFHCSLHSGWDKTLCEKGCYPDRFPLWAWGLWELVGLCTVPIGGGFVVINRIGLEEFKHFVGKLNLTQDEEDEVFDILKRMLALWESMNDKKDYIIPREELEVLIKEEDARYAALD